VDGPVEKKIGKLKRYAEKSDVYYKKHVINHVFVKISEDFPKKL
jgi:hypothetical protein